MVLLEAMAAQTAIVASDLAGYGNVAREPGSTRCSCRRATRAPWPPRSGGCSSDGCLNGELVASGEARAWSFSMDRLAERYVSVLPDAAPR